MVWVWLTKLGLDTNVGPQLYWQLRKLYGGKELVTSLGWVLVQNGQDWGSQFRWVNCSWRGIYVSHLGLVQAWALHEGTWDRWYKWYLNGCVGEVTQRGAAAVGSQS